jgi:diguanylate cyclase (GGDEF)-like protein
VDRTLPGVILVTLLLLSATYGRGLVPVAEPASPGPAAAQRYRGSTHAPPPVPPPTGPAGDAALSAVLDATRALLWIESPIAVAEIARDLVETLGGRVVRAVDATEDALPVDVSFSVGEPVLPAAPQAGVARMLLERYLPAFVRDAQRALELLDRPSRLAQDASIDPLTGLANRRTLGRALGRLRSEDTVVMIDLDHFKAINDGFGHREGDKVLRLFGRTLAATVRAADQVGRYGGEEFVVILPGNGAERLLARLRIEWMRARPYPVTFSAGVADAQPDPRKALHAADRALYRAKQTGRNRWERSIGEDYQ